MKDVKSSYNSYTGMELNLAEDSECAMNMVEASYNGYHGFEIWLYGGSEATMSNVKASYNTWKGVLYYAFQSAQSHNPAKVYLKGTNFFNDFFNENKKSTKSVGIDVDGSGKIDINVSKGKTTALKNRSGVYLTQPVATLTVEKSGALIACGNGSSGSSDIYGAYNYPTNQFFPLSSKRYTCGSTYDAMAFECENECPVCD